MPSFITLREPKPSKHDVYLSSDHNTGRGFAGYLDKYLTEGRFSCCKDNMVEIEKSRIFIVIFSQHYPYSSNRLDELVQIERFALANRRQILTIFYKVHPSDVLHRSGEYERALAAHQNSVTPERLDGWTTALTYFGGTNGIHIDGGRDINESQYIGEIIQEVSEHVPCKIGLHHRVQKVIECLGSDDRVLMAGICGDPGIGKTTVARAVCDYFVDNNFDYYGIVDKGEEYSKGLLHLPRMLHSKIVGDNITEIEDVEEMMSVLGQKKIFLIIEDVGKLEQLKAIDKLNSLLGFGSIVIITSQEKSLLREHGINTIYEVDRFIVEEAYEFLNLKVCKSVDIQIKYASIIRQAAKICASGCPLDLEIIGSDLGGKEINECISTLDRYEKTPNIGTQEIQKVCFNGLGKNYQQILIYIVEHNLRGQELEVVEQALTGSFNGCPWENIKVLRNKSLIKINEHCQVTLHNSTWKMVKEYATSSRRFGGFHSCITITIVVALAIFVSNFLRES